MRQTNGKKGGKSKENLFLPRVFRNNLFLNETMAGMLQHENFSFNIIEGQVDQVLNS